MPKINNKTTRDARRKQAEERQEKYSKLPLIEKLARIKSRPGESRREKARLETV